MKPTYLDYAATTPLDPRVKDAMEPYWSKEFGNPSSLYPLGKRGERAIEEARGKIASILHARPEEIIFTGGGTEAANLAIFGVSQRFSSGHIISTPIEHPAVLEPVHVLNTRGYAVTLVSVDEYGRIDPEEIPKSLRPDTILVTVMYANNEIGTVEPIAEIGKLIKKFKKENKKGAHEPPYFFTDACQAAGYLSLDVEKLGVDLLAFNGSKLYGPKGVGALYVRKGIPISPIIYGGGQERGLRSGTENVPAIVGLAKALEIADRERASESARLVEFRDYCMKEVLRIAPRARINGHMTERLPNNINISIPGTEGDTLVIYLGERGISVSTGSACSSKDLEPSHVLKAIKCPEEYLRGSLRISLGKHTTKEDIDFFIQTLSETLTTLKK